MYALGLDIGSSSVKGALVRLDTGETVSLTKYPDSEMTMSAHQPGWAEQAPDVWWQSVCQVTKTLLATSGVDAGSIESIGIAYQMHGLVLIDESRDVLRPAIIWCDSRAVDIGRQAFETLGANHCLSRYLNSPGNFTASKLRWVKTHEPEIFNQASQLLLPGDYIAMQLTGQLSTTISGLSEGILWDFKAHDLSKDLLNLYGIPEEMIPPLTNTFGVQGELSDAAARQTGLKAGTLVSYRAGDQPNNAMSLGVLEPNEVAATGGTSGVIYGVVDHLSYDSMSRVNGFAHVNHGQDQTRIGQLLCINGAGSLYAWMRQQIGHGMITYEDMEQLQQQIPVGSDGLTILPFGNGAERILKNGDPGASIHGLNFNVHAKQHLYRASLEGIACAFRYGFDVLSTVGLRPSTIRVGNDNLFQSSIFSQTVATLLNVRIEVMDTNGATGAALGSAYGIGRYPTLGQAFENLRIEHTYFADADRGPCHTMYHRWLDILGTS